jgi:hypothetical protein
MQMICMGLEQRVSKADDPQNYTPFRNVARSGTCVSLGRKVFEYRADVHLAFVYLESDTDNQK